MHSSSFRIVVILALYWCATVALIQDIHFQLFTRHNLFEPQILELNDTNLLENSSYNHSLPTKFFIHGWVGSPTAGYPSKDGYLKRMECNFICVNWSAMAVGELGYVAENYVPIAGQLTGQFINFLNERGTPLASMHIIAHSFGSHVAGFAGKAVPTGKVSRITALDPSSTDYFTPMDDPKTRLDSTDALFVDVIHTQSRYYLMTLGHIDFYPNGGTSQPGCVETSGECCAHCRAVDIFGESITTDVGFRSLQCATWEFYQSGACKDNESVFMGAFLPETASGIFHLETNAESPFALG